MKPASSPSENEAPPVQHMTRAAMNASRHHLRQRLLIVGGRLALLVCLLGLWQWVSGPLINPLFLSSPLAVVRQFVAWTLDGTLWYHTSITLEETLLGLWYGLLSGILAGLLLGLLQMAAKILDPFLVAVYSIPKIALAPLFILWFGIELPMKVIFVAVTVFFLVFLSTLAGVRNVDQGLVDAVLLMGGNRRDIVLKVIIPAATGSILTGVRIAIPYALIGAVIAELIASNRGIGYLVESSAATFDTTGTFAALLALSMIAGLLNVIVHVIDQKTSRWKAGMTLERKMTP
jgi:NitT/TauT family transport system permease protein